MRSALDTKYPSCCAISTDALFTVRHADCHVALGRRVCHQLANFDTALAMHRSTGLHALHTDHGSGYQHDSPHYQKIGAYSVDHAIAMNAAVSVYLVPHQGERFLSHQYNAVLLGF